MERKETKSFDICFFVTFSCYDQSLVSGKQTGHQALPPINFKIFILFLSFLKSYVLKRSPNYQATHIQSLLYKKSRPALLVANKTYVKVLHCLIILLTPVQHSEKDRVFFCSQKRFSSRYVQIWEDQYWILWLKNSIKREKSRFFQVQYHF